jgi:hypothetical protein
MREESLPLVALHMQVGQLLVPDSSQPDRRRGLQDTCRRIRDMLQTSVPESVSGSY